MDLKESPSLSDNKVCPFGSFVIVSLDPVASVAGLKDEHATEQAAGLPHKKYLAIIAMFADLQWGVPPPMQPLNLTFCGVGRDPPDHPSAFVALFPDASHPSNREPILPSAPLPWPDCCVHTIARFDICIMTLHYSNPSGLVSVSMSDLITLEDAHNADCLEIDSTPLVLHEDSEDDDKFREIEDQLTYNYSGLGSSGSGDDSSGSDADSGSANNESGAYQGGGVVKVPKKLARRRVTYSGEMWLDIFGAHEIGNPTELMDTIKRLDLIEKEWAERAVLGLLADQPQTRKWVEDVAAAETSISVESLPSPVDNPSVVQDGDPIAASPAASVQIVVKDLGVTVEDQAHSSHDKPRSLPSVTDPVRSDLMDGSQVKQEHEGVRKYRMIRRVLNYVGNRTRKFFNFVFCT